MKNPEKLVANSIPGKFLKFSWTCLESSLAHWVKCTYWKLRSVLGSLQKAFWCAKSVTNGIYFGNIIFPVTFIKLRLKPIQNNKIEQSPD